ncbi:hypothetical protein FA13DRAFT_418288 [Coprinellus micaceus]|uniref:C3H1-type domain-containing protein n=1 Tax=Coprinellus micaceus TaxID=71717 RepID=A0A4Y7TXM9_COPMI|nr:hypothetical protein FA13DRAFT_418288 [Coprinellus micaceus]
MVSPIWKAVFDGDLDAVLAILNGPVDLEERDHTGATPLVEAVKNGHIEVVRVLLNKGADPYVATSHGRVETYTQDPAIYELVRSYQAPVHPDPSQENVYAHDDAGKGYYPPPPPPPGAYGYYPPMNGVMPPMGDAGVYYPPPHPNGDANAAAFGHLPPPDIAKMIPCRYYPACRFGVHCIFAHPVAPFNGPPPPPGQYPPFDPAMGSPYAYYPPPPPPAFQQPNINVTSQMSPMSPPPGPPSMHGRSPSEVVSPQAGFPNGAPHPPAMGHYGPMSPSSYPHPGPIPVPMSVPPLPPTMHHQPPPPSGPVPQSPTALYNPVVPFPGHDGQYFPPPPMGYPDADGKPPGSNGQLDGFVPQPAFRDGNGPRRGGAPRRNSFLKANKPPCMFFPSGRCKNGDDCRFPHILSENPGPNHAHHYFVPRGGAPRPPRGPSHVNGVSVISQKMGNMNVRDDAPRPQNGAAEGSSRSQSTDPGNRPKFQLGPHKHHHHQNGVNGKRVPGAATVRPQRVPSADDFPVLPGSVTPPKRVNGVNGPTAAQILSAPAPIKKENTASTVSTSGSVRARSPEPVSSKEEPQVEVTKHTPAPEKAHEATPVPVQTPALVAQKFPLSFAAAAKTAAAASAPETPKEVSVSA